MRDIVESSFGPNATRAFGWWFNALLTSASAVALCIMGLETKNLAELCGIEITMFTACTLIFVAMLLLNQVRDVSWIARLSYIAV